MTSGAEYSNTFEKMITVRESNFLSMLDDVFSWSSFQWFYSFFVSEQFDKIAKFLIWISLESLCKYISSSLQLTKLKFDRVNKIFQKWVKLKIEEIPLNLVIHLRIIFHPETGNVRSGYLLPVAVLQCLHGASVGETMVRSSWRQSHTWCTSVQIYGWWREFYSVRSSADNNFIFLILAHPTRERQRRRIHERGLRALAAIEQWQRMGRPRGQIPATTNNRHLPIALSREAQHWRTIHQLISASTVKAKRRGADASKQ